MPWILRLFYIIGAFSPLSITILFSPGDWTHEDTGETISQDELWEQGAIIESILFFLALFLTALLIHYKKKIVRYIMAVFFLSSVTEYLSCGYFGLFIFFSVYLFILYQLFFSQKTKAYFQKK